MAKDTYDASKIQVLQGLEAVRKRPAMYIGSTDRTGLHHLVTEIINNSVDEAIAGFCTRIWLELNEDGSLMVEDNGRGIPVDIHPVTKRPALETIMTNLHAGGKFDSGAYKVSGGLHGVGLKCTNALSEWMKTTVYKDGFEYQQEYARGKVMNDVTKIGPTTKNGTKHIFKPDSEIFSDINFDMDAILRICRESAYLTRGLMFTVKDNRTGDKTNLSTYQLYFEDGIKSYVQYLNLDEKVVGNALYLSGKEDDVFVEVAIQYNLTMDEKVRYYTNNIINPEGGTHAAGFKTGLTKAINSYANNSGALKGLKDETLGGEDVREGLTAIISIKVPDPQFEGQTKIKLNNPEVQGIVMKVVKDGLETYLNEHPKEAKLIIEKAFLSYKARIAAKAAREAVIRKSTLEGGGLPGKLADCSNKNPAECELYLVEGDSAGGTAKQGRDRKTQAVLPLRGKPINSQKYRLDRVLANEELKNLVTALGCGIGENYNSDKLRYHKIVIMADADVDGQHICTLILTLLFRHIRQLISEGYIYIAQPPLFKVEVAKETFYFLNEDDKNRFVAQLQAKGRVGTINRFKGLGEMNDTQLWDTTMNPATRVLKKVTIEDAEEAERIFEMLMGDEVPPRRRFIQSNAKYATIDV